MLLLSGAMVLWSSQSIPQEDGRAPGGKRDLLDKFIRLPGSHVEVRYEPGLPEARARQQLAIYERAYAEVARDFDVSLSHPIFIYFYSDDTYQSIYGHFAYVAAHSDVGPRMGPNIHLPFTFDIRRFADRTGLAYHEMTHQIVRELSGGRAPRWLDEGLAVYEEDKVAPRLKEDREAIRLRAKKEVLFLPFEEVERTGQIASKDVGGKEGLLSFEELESVFLERKAEFQSLAYAQAHVAVRKLIDEHGFSQVRALLVLLQGGRGFEDAFRETFQTTTSEFLKALTLELEEAKE